VINMFIAKQLAWGQKSSVTFKIVGRTKFYSSNTNRRTDSQQFCV